SSNGSQNIPDHARQAQKLVLKVLRVNPQRNQIDLSLRRVTGREKSEKMLEWKKERKADAILKSAADKLQRPEPEIDDLRTVLLDKFGSLYEPLEESIDNGTEALAKAGVSPEWAQALAEISKTKIRLERSEVRAPLSILCHKHGGLDILNTSSTT